MLRNAHKTTKKSWGGTPVQSWADQSALQAISSYTDALESIADMDEKLDEFKEWLSLLDNFTNTAKSSASAPAAKTPATKHFPSAG